MEWLINLGSDDGLTFKVVDRRTGEPIPQGALATTRSVDGPWPDGTTSRSPSTTGEGTALIPVPSGVQLLEIVTRIDGSRTRVCSGSRPGDMRSRRIMFFNWNREFRWGTVLDPEGNPAAGAEVVVSPIGIGVGVQGPESHEFGSMTAVTDNAGTLDTGPGGSDVPARCSSAPRTPNSASETLWLRILGWGSVPCELKRRFCGCRESRIPKGAWWTNWGRDCGREGPGSRTVPARGGHRVGRKLFDGGMSREQPLGSRRGVWFRPGPLCHSTL